MKVALILYGQPRFIQRDDVYKSHIDNIVYKYDDVDIYAHMWWHPFDHFGTTSSWAKDHGTQDFMSCPIDAPALIATKYHPKRMLIMPPQRFEPEPQTKQILESRFTGNKYFSWENWSNIASQLTALQEASLLVEQANQYDWLVMARYDALLENFPDLTTLEPGFYCPQGGHFNDLIHVYKPVYNEFFNYLASAANDPWILNKIDLPIPELFKYWHYQSCFMQEPKKIGMYAHVIRN